MHFHIITIFPESIKAYLDSSILARAQRYGAIKISFYNPRDFVKDKHRQVDDRPYGGGPGMALMAEPILKAAARAVGRKKKATVLIMSARGKQFEGAYASKLSELKDLVLISGHYEGIDERVRKILKADEISIGPYVLTGGELPAAVVVDAASRFVPGVLGKSESLEEERIASREVYTRPEVLKWKNKKYAVPKILLSGDHKKIEEWRISN